MTEPTRLTAEQLLPLAVAIERRRRQSGPLHLRRSLPACPTCDQPATDVTTGVSPNFFTDSSGILFEPCGHKFTVDSETALTAAERASAIVAGEADG